MRILLQVSNFPPFRTSTARLYAELANDLTDAGHEVWVVTQAMRGGPVGMERLSSGVMVLREPQLGTPRNVPLLRAIEQLWFALRYTTSAFRLPRPDVILVYSPPLPLAAAMIPFARIRGARIVVNVQDLYPKTAVDLGLLRGRLAIGLAKRLERFVYEQADAVAVHSEGNRAYVIEHGVAAGRAHSILNWVEARDFLEPARTRDTLEGLGIRSKFVAFYGGTMGWAQSIGDILNAAEILLDQPDILFLLVGEGVMRVPMEEDAKKRGLTNVRFLDAVPMETYNRILLESDLALVTLQDALASPVVPGKLQSIMAAGKPVLVSTNPASDAKRFVEEAQCGFFVRAGRGKELAAAIRQMRADPKGLEIMGERGRAYALKAFDRSRGTRAYESLLRGLLHPAPEEATRDG
jgi:glycosyltransferase involved in cell wall biosynthesis